MISVRLSVNGAEESLDLEPRTLLVHALRSLGLTGTKVGCDTSQCGTCTVLVDGHAVKSCTLLAAQAQEASVTTIEGLAQAGHLHAIQEAFRLHHALQCGFCTPGMVMAAADLLSREPAPDRDAIRDALDGNLCRCTGYQPIVDAIAAAAGLEPAPARGNQADGAATSGALGVARPRVEAVAKLTGATRYTADREIPRLLHARPVLSPFTRARIDRIEIDAVLGLPGVHAVLSADDLPVNDAVGRRQFEPLARDQVVFAGQPVALVVADSEALAEDAAGAVVVEYTPLSPVLDLENASSAGAAPARPPSSGSPADTAAEAPREGSSPNVVSEQLYRLGDVDQALAGCDAIVEGRFRTNWVYQAPMEPHAATAWVEPDGELVVHSSTQAIFFTRQQLSRLFGLPLSRIRVAGAPVGGSFGAKLLLVEPLAAAAALRLRRPVRLVLTRSEDVTAGQPAPASLVDVKIGATQGGELVALKADLRFDTGAFADWSRESVIALHVAGPYRWRTAESRSRGVMTNRFGRGAYRAPGGPQAAFAVESLLDELAARLGIDPLELRRRNAAVEGDTRIDGSTWPSTGTRECLDELERHPLWARRAWLPEGEGVGLALGLWSGSLHPGAALCRLDGDGCLTVVTGLADMSSNETSLATIAAEAFGVSPDDVLMTFSDTSTAPFAPLSGGSAITYSLGLAIRRAAEAARERLIARAAPRLEADPDDLEIVDGVVRPIGAPDQGVSVAALAGELAGFSSPPIEGHGEAALGVPAPSAAAHLAHVRVDRATGLPTLLGHVVAQDAGRAINPALVEGQMRGAVAQGVGWALTEELVHDEEGQLVTGSFLQYAIPRARQVPDIDTIVVEVPSAEGPFGARGVGEAPVVSAPAAIANGLAAASGARLRELPMTPERVWRALNGSP